MEERDFKTEKLDEKDVGEFCEWTSQLQTEMVQAKFLSKDRVGVPIESVWTSSAQEVETMKTKKKRTQNKTYTDPRQDE